MPSALRAGLLGAGGRVAAAAGISARVTARTEGVLNPMLPRKLKMALLFFLGVGIVIAGKGLLTHRSEASSVTGGNPESAESEDGVPWKTLIADLEKQIPKLMEEAKVPGL